MFVISEGIYLAVRAERKEGKYFHQIVPRS